MLDEFQINTKIISTDYFANNYKASKIGTQDYYIIKTIKRYNDKFIDSREIENILKDINHPDIIKIIDIR